MSEHEIIIIPAEPERMPAEHIIAATESFIRQLFPNAEYVNIICSEQIHYYDCGGNFEHIHCPVCRTELSVAQWHQLMDADYNIEQNSFAMQSMPLPCCGHQCNLNQLQYSFEQGFSRFAITMNNSVGAVDDAAKTAIERFLGGCVIKVIYRH